MLYRVLIYNEHFNKTIFCRSKAETEKRIETEKKNGFTNYKILNEKKKKTTKIDNM